MADSTTTFDSHNPVTNEVISSHEIYNETAVVAAVVAAVVVVDNELLPDLPMVVRSPDMPAGGE